MKKSALSLSITLCLSIHLKAQDNYFPFKVNGKHGITDTIANEIIKPQYKYLTLKPDHAALLQNFDIGKDILINRQTGKIHTSESIQGKCVQIADKPYYLLSGNKKATLLDITTGKTIALNEEYHEMANEGKYIVAKYYPHAKPVPKTEQAKKVQGKGFIPPPPVIAEFLPLNGLTIFNNSLPLTKAFDGPYSNYTILYKGEEEKVKEEEEDNEHPIVTVETVFIEPWSEPLSPDFHAILLHNFETNSLYSYDLQLIDSFKEEDYTKEQRVDKVREILKTDVNDWDSRTADRGMVSAAPLNVANSSKSRPADKPKINYPILITTKLNTGYQQVVLQQSEEKQVKLFRTKNKVSISGNEITIDSNKGSEFTVNLKTGKVRLPKKYWAILGLMAQ